MVRLASILALAGTAAALPSELLTPRQTTSSCKAQTSLAAVNDAKLPDPFTFGDGSKVATKADWTCRQTEILNAMEQYEIGAFPPPPDKVEATLSGTGLSIKVTVGSKSITMSASIKKCAAGSNCPAFITIGGASIPVPNTVATINFGNDAFAQQNNKNSHGTGLFFNLFGASHTAGALTAWAWGVGRIIDALEQLGADKTGIDTTRLGTTGCSRNGKGAFMVGALEKRIALTVPQESGSGGAACWRVSDSEKSKGKNIQTASQIITENAWFSPRFNSYVSATNTIPGDHHYLAALVAPRGLFVIENDIDWLGPVATTGCMKAGRQIYDAVGVRSNMGFSLVGGHSHCQFPSATTANLNSYINKFLLGTSQTTNDVETSKATVNMAEWTGSWSAAPKITLS